MDVPFVSIVVLGPKWPFITRLDMRRHVPRQQDLLSLPFCLPVTRSSSASIVKRAPIHADCHSLPPVVK